MMDADDAIRLVGNDVRPVNDWLELPADARGVYDARLRTSGVQVWAIAGQLQGNDIDIDAIAAAWAIAPGEVAAVLDYYREHREAIDAHLAFVNDRLRHAS